MNYFLLKPEVAGGLGEGSKVVYEDNRLKEVIFLEYCFEGWQGDELLSTHPCFIVSENLQESIIMNDLKGVSFKQIGMTFSEEFYELYDGIILPQFVQLLCGENYESNIDNLQYDFYFSKYKELIVSERALNILKKHRIDMCIIEKCS